MKSAHLAVVCAIASLSVGCDAEQTASLDHEELKEPALANHADASQMVKPPSAVRETATLTSPNSISFSSHETPSHKNVIAQTTRLTNSSRQSRSTISTTALGQGRDNPFALAEQPEFEVRFLAPIAPADIQPLQPLPSVGLGPEVGGASLIPVEAAPVVMNELPTASPAAVIQPSVVVSPLAVQLPEMSTDLPLVSPVADAGAPLSVSPTALAEAVEISGIVQLGEHSAVIVKDSDGALSRTVHLGERIAGGQVELRRIETTTAEPQVVLVQNGIEVFRGVGV